MQVCENNCCSCISGPWYRCISAKCWLALCREKCRDATARRRNGGTPFETSNDTFSFALLLHRAEGLRLWWDNERRMRYSGSNLLGYAVSAFILFFNGESSSYFLYFVPAFPIFSRHFSSLFPLFRSIFSFCSPILVFRSIYLIHIWLSFKTARLKFLESGKHSSSLRNM